MAQVGEGRLPQGLTPSLAALAAQVGEGRLLKASGVVNGAFALTVVVGVARLILLVILHTTRDRSIVSPFYHTAFIGGPQWLANRRAMPLPNGSAYAYGRQWRAQQAQRAAAMGRGDSCWGYSGQDYWSQSSTCTGNPTESSGLGDEWPAELPRESRMLTGPGGDEWPREMLTATCAPRSLFTSPGLP